MRGAATGCSPGDMWCASCRLTRGRPDTGNPDAVDAWSRAWVGRVRPPLERRRRRLQVPFGRAARQVRRRSGPQMTTKTATSGSSRPRAIDAAGPQGPVAFVVSCGPPPALAAAMGTRSRRVASFGRMADDAVAPCSPTPVRAGLHLLNENTFVYFVQPIAYFDDGVAVRRVGGDRTAVDRPVREGLLRSTSTWAVARRSSPCSAGSRTCGPARRPLTRRPSLRGPSHVAADRAGRRVHRDRGGCRVAGHRLCVLVTVGDAIRTTGNDGPSHRARKGRTPVRVCRYTGSMLTRVRRTQPTETGTIG